MQRRAESSLVSEWADCISGQFLLDLLPSVQSHKWLHLDKTVTKEIRPGSSALRKQALVFVQRGKLHKHQLKSALYHKVGLWEPGENFPLFRRAWHRLAVPQTKEGRGTKNSCQRKEVEWISVQTYASIKPSGAEVQKWGENPCPCSWWVHSHRQIDLAVQACDLWEVTNNTSWDSVEHQYHEMPVVQLLCGVILL